MLSTCIKECGIKKQLSLSLGEISTVRLNVFDKF